MPKYPWGDPDVGWEQTKVIVPELDRALYDGRAIVLGVTDEPGGQSFTDRLTDHWVVVVERGYESGAVYYTAIDNANGDAKVTRFYLSGDGSQLVRDPPSSSLRGTAGNRYVASQVRRSTSTSAGANP